jgi:hypothetical protein
MINRPAHHIFLGQQRQPRPEQALKFMGVLKHPKLLLD